jgi:hypothetical protein
MAEKDWAALADKVTSVFHCAAEVDYVKTYADLRAANVLGTREIIHLCSRRAPKILHHISRPSSLAGRQTCAVAEDDYNAAMQGLDFGYIQSKWVAEQHGISCDAVNQLSLLPVDICAQNIVSLSLLTELEARTFHLTADEYYTLGMACRCITERHGYSFEYVDLNAFEDILFTLVVFFRTNKHKIEIVREKRYVSSNYRAARARSEHTVAEPDLADIMDSVIAFLRRERLIPSRPHVARAGAPLRALQLGSE